MVTEEIEVVGGKFEYHDKTYDCSHLIKRDIDTITREADDTHKGVLDSLYKRETLQPYKVRVFIDSKGSIAYLMIVYRIDYKVGNSTRQACGDYYPVSDSDETDILLFPHPYQGSICW